MFDEESNNIVMKIKGIITASFQFRRGSCKFKAFLYTFKGNKIKPVGIKMMKF